MKGIVDDYGRSLIRITVWHPAKDTNAELDAWIDTGFTGSLLLTTEQIEQLDLPLLTTVPGAMANGQQVTFEAFTSRVDWFGTRRLVDTLKGSGRFALVGVGLLEDCSLTIDYPSRSVNLVLANGQM